MGKTLYRQFTSDSYLEKNSVRMILLQLHKNNCFCVHLPSIWQQTLKEFTDQAISNNFGCTSVEYTKKYGECDAQR